MKKSKANAPPLSEDQSVITDYFKKKDTHLRIAELEGQFKRVKVAFKLVYADVKQQKTESEAMKEVIEALTECHCTLHDQSRIAAERSEWRISRLERTLLAHGEPRKLRSDTRRETLGGK